MRRGGLAAPLLAALTLCGCSTLDPAALEGELGTATALAPLAGTAGGQRILVARVQAPPPTPPAEEAARGPLPFDGGALQAELGRALERVVDPALGGRVGLAADEDAIAEAWREGGYDLVVIPRLRRWEAVFLDTTGWWYPNALFVAWYFWPVGQWFIADEVYGLDCELELQVVGVGSELPLPDLDRRAIVVRSAPPDEELPPPGRLEVAHAPRVVLSDFQRGIDFLGTYFPGELELEQWEQVGRLLAPSARRLTALRAAAAVGDAIERLRGEPPGALAAVHAVVVGIAGYPRPCPAADQDAQRVADLLRGEWPAPDGDPAAATAAPVDSGDVAAVGSPGVAGLRPRRPGAWAPDKNVVLRRNGDADRAALLARLAEAAARVGPRDTFVFYFAGRGERAPDGEGLARLRLLTYPRGRPDEPDWITLEELGQALAAVPAENRIVILDVDLAGGPIDPGVGRPRGSPAGAPGALEGLEGALQGALLAGEARRGAVILASSTGPDEVVQTYEEGGLLTTYLLRGLADEAADAGGDGLTWGDLATWLERHVVNLSEVALPAPQRPLVVTPSPEAPIR